MIDIYIKEGEKRQECEIASYFKEKLEEIPSFGCSDCKCSSHLFYKEKENYEGDIKELDMYKYLI